MSSSSSLLAISSPAGFAHHVSGGRWKPARHLLLISDALVDIAAGRLTRLIVTLPPRHGKSSLISQYFPAWYLGLYPNRRILLASYEASFAASWGRRARDVLTQWGPSLFGVTVSDVTSAQDEWEVVPVEGAEEDAAIIRGGMVTAGVGGSITGRGAHVLIIDDPVKNQDDARSKTLQEKQLDWFLSTAYTRLESDPEGAVIIIMTRWNEGDLVGRILAAEKEASDEEKERWTIVNLPALAEDDDPLGRERGEALWPERFPVERLHRIRRRLGGYWFAALYQQRPQPEEGGIFKRQHFRYYQTELVDDALYLILPGENGGRYYPDKECWSFATIDLAASLKTSADWTVIAIWTVTPATDVLLRQVIRFRLEGPDQPDQIIFAYHRWRLAVIGVEKAFWGITLIQLLLRKGYPVIPLETDVDKIARALPAGALYQAGMVWHPVYADWLDEWEAELISFPNAAHDDQVDTAGHMARLLAQWEAGPNEETVVYEERVSISPV